MILGPSKKDVSDGSKNKMLSNAYLNKPNLSSKAFVFYFPPPSYSVAAQDTREGN